MGAEKNNPGGAGPAKWEKVSTVGLDYIFGAYAIVIVAGIAAYLLARTQDLQIEVTEDFAAFAVLYIAAQAVERLIQPLTYWLGKAEEKKEVKTVLTASSQRAVSQDTAEAETEVEQVAQAKKALAVIQSERAVLFWAIATAVALLMAGALDLGFIESVAEITGTGDDGEVPSSFHYIDVFVTGAVIGAGTKPLHDLIKVIQNTKQKTESGAEATA